MWSDGSCSIIHQVLCCLPQVKGGVAEADGRLMQGDQILAVNSEDMRNSTQEYAAAVLKVTFATINSLCCGGGHSYM